MSVKQKLEFKGSRISVQFKKATLFTTFIMLFSAAIPLSLDITAGSCFACPTKDETREQRRLFQTELHGVICKPCLKALADEIKSNEEVIRVRIKTRRPNRGANQGKKYAELKVIYKSPGLKKEDLVEIIEFRDFKALEVIDRAI